MMKAMLCCALLSMFCLGCLPPRLIAKRDRAREVAEDSSKPLMVWCVTPEDPKKYEKCPLDVKEGDILVPGPLVPGGSKDGG